MPVNQLFPPPMRALIIANNEQEMPHTRWLNFLTEVCASVLSRSETLQVWHSDRDAAMQSVAIMADLKYTHRIPELSERLKEIARRYEVKLITQKLTGTSHL